MDTRSPPWFWQVSLLKSHDHPFTEIMYQEFLKVMFEHPTNDKNGNKNTNYHNNDKQSDNNNND